VQGVIRTYDPQTREGVVMRDTDREEFTLSLAALDGSCRTPIAGFAETDGGRLTIEGVLLKEDGSKEIRGRFEGGIDDAAQIGAELGKDLRSRAGPDFGLG